MALHAVIIYLFIFLLLWKFDRCWWISSTYIILANIELIGRFCVSLKFIGFRVR